MAVVEPYVFPVAFGINNVGHVIWNGEGKPFLYNIGKFVEWCKCRIKKINTPTLKIPVKDVGDVVSVLKITFGQSPNYGGPVMLFNASPDFCFCHFVYSEEDLCYKAVFTTTTESQNVFELSNAFDFLGAVREECGF